MFPALDVIWLYFLKLLKKLCPIFNVINMQYFYKICDVSTPSELWGIADLLVEKNRLIYGHEKSETIFDGEKKLVVYGAGRFAEAMVRTWLKNGIKPEYFVDGDPQKWGTMLLNIPVLNPHGMFDEATENLVVVIAAMVTHDIEKILLKKSVTFLFAERDGSIGYLPGHWLLSHRLEFEKIYSSLADDASRRVMLEMAKARLFQCHNFPMRGNFFSSEIATQPQYFVEDIMSFVDGEVFIDCGAFDGDTLVAFSALMHRLGGCRWQAIAFEADPGNIKLLLRTLQDYEIKQVKLFNAAVGDHNGKAAMACFHNCRESVDASLEIQIMKLDDALHGVSPTFIKMDIEGYELAALKGAREVILNNYPKLAISIYHSTRDFLEIPIYILNRFPGYKIYMRHHSSGTLWETVCYAIPT